MRRFNLSIYVWTFGLLVAGEIGCQWTNSPSSLDEPEVQNRSSAVLIFTLDGLGFDILNASPEGKAFIAENGVTRLIPPIPVVTFPSHATMIFGVDPEFHGVLENFTLPSKYAAPHATIDPFKSKVWHQLKASHVRLQLTGVGELKTFADVKPLDVDVFAEVEDKFKAMQNAAAQLSRESDLISLVWSEGTDDVGHKFGPDSREVQDRVVVLLTELRRLKKIALKPDSFPYKHTTFIFVSDHGMAELKTCTPYLAAKETIDFTHGASYVILKSATAVAMARDYIAQKLPDATLTIYNNPALAVKGILTLPEGMRFDNQGSKCLLTAKGNHQFDPFKFSSQHGVFWVWNAQVEAPHPTNNIDIMAYAARQFTGK